MKKIMIVEDDKDICRELKEMLDHAGYEGVVLSDFHNGCRQILKAKPDLVLLDINIPFQNGEMLLKELRESSDVPVIMVTSRESEADEVLSMSYGADDYIVKPFDSEVLILKIKAILSRSKHEEAEPKPKFITIGEYVFNTELRTITKNEEQIKLTPKEARLLELLYNYKDGLLPREKALTEIWGTNDYFTARSMDVYVTKLRKYFKDDQNIKIENVHGSGFRLVIEE